jgi:hypothetical protein
MPNLEAETRIDRAGRRMLFEGNNRPGVNLLGGCTPGSAPFSGPPGIRGEPDAQPDQFPGSAGLVLPIRLVLPSRSCPD